MAGKAWGRRSYSGWSAAVVELGGDGEFCPECMTATVSAVAAMSDPAIEAAQRSADAIEQKRRKRCAPRDRIFAPGAYPREVSAAREMAKPIRELHEYWSSEAVLPPEAWQILDQLAPLIFTSEELER